MKTYYFLRWLQSRIRNYESEKEQMCRDYDDLFRKKREMEDKRVREWIRLVSCFRELLLD